MRRPRSSSGLFSSSARAFFGWPFSRIGMGSGLRRGGMKVAFGFQLIERGKSRSFRAMSLFALKRKTMKTPPGWALEVFAR